MGIVGRKESSANLRRMIQMKRKLAVSLLVFAALSLSAWSEAARVRVVHHTRRRTTVVVHRGFPLHRALPHVVVRTPAVAVRVTPRAFLPSLVFSAAVVASLPAREARVWEDRTALDRDDGWTDFTMNVDRRGRQLYVAIGKGPAQISFAEVVFENGEAQVIDFDDHVHREGIYSLADFRDGRKVDHVRMVAKADSRSSEISLHLVS
jgi:hypothetical protein